MLAEALTQQTALTTLERRDRGGRTGPGVRAASDPPPTPDTGDQQNQNTPGLGNGCEIP